MPAVNALDIVLALVILTAAVVQAVRGFGRAVWDAGLLWGALALANLVSPLLGGVPLAYGVVLVVFGALALLLSRWLYSVTQGHAGAFNGLLGLAAGLAAGVMLAHGTVRILSATGGMGRAQVAESPLGSEMLTFQTFHATLQNLQAETLSQRPLPDVAH